MSVTLAVTTIHVNKHHKLLKSTSRAINFAQRETQIVILSTERAILFKEVTVTIQIHSPRSSV